MMPADRRLVALLGAIVMVAACQPVSLATTPTSAAVDAPSAVLPTETSTPSPNPATLAVKDGEPWIAYQAPYDPDGDGTYGNGLYMVRPDGRDQHLVLTANAGHPDWSPDGKRIAVEAEPRYTGTRIWTLNADGTDVKDLLECSGVCTDVASPAWSPDGKQMAYMRFLTGAAPGYQDDRVAIEVVDLSTGASRIVAMPPDPGSEYTEYIYPRWSPDRQQITFMVRTYATPPTDDNVFATAVAVVKADGSEVDAPRILTDPALLGAYPDWSPDGQRIVLESLELPNSQSAVNLFTIRPDGSGLTQVTQFSSTDSQAVIPRWTPDGTQIIFTQIERQPESGMGDRKIAFIDPDGTNLTLVPTEGWAWLGRLRPTP